MTCNCLTLAANFNKFLCKTLHCNRREALTFSGHPHIEAFLQTAVLTAVTTERCDFAFFLVGTAMGHALSDTATEEALQQTSQIHESTYIWVLQ